MGQGHDGSERGRWEVSLRERVVYLVCPWLRDEIEALRSGNTKVVLENQRLLDELAKAKP